MLLLALLLALPASADSVLESSHTAAMAQLRGWFMSESSEAPKLVLETDDLLFLQDDIAFHKKGRVAGVDDWQTYSDQTVILAHRLGVEPPEDAIPVYRGLVRASTAPLTETEQAVHERLTSSANAPGLPKRYLFIGDLVGTPLPQLPILKEKVVYKKVKGKKVKKVIPAPETLPLPRETSILARIDWERADELAEVADDNARAWDRKPKESLKRYRRRLRQLRNRCYEWVRRDMTELGIWDAGLFRGFVPPTRRDRSRPIRAASFAVAMAKIEADEKLASKTSLRQLNLRVDPLVRGAIVVFQKSICGYSARSGHIEVITSLEPLQAASFKFHPVKTECLIKAANENKVHVFVPLRS